MNRNPFLYTSGFNPFEVDDIIYRTKQVIRTLKQQKERRRKERKAVKFFIHNRGLTTLDAIIEAKKTMIMGKRLRNNNQIQRGFDTAKRWRFEYEAMEKDNAGSGSDGDTAQ